MPKYKGPYWIHSDPTAPDETPAPAPSNGPCPHWCNHKWRKALEAHERALEKWIARGCVGEEPQPPEIRPWPGEPNLCRKCAAIVRAALRELPHAYDALESHKYLTRTASAGEERRGRSDAAPSPSPGADHQDEIARLGSTWEDALRKHLRHQAATDQFGDHRATLEAAVEYLNANYLDLLETCDYDFVEEFANDIHGAYATAVAMSKNKPVRKHLPEPCPSLGCGVKALIQEEGLANKPWYIECSERLGGCGRLYAEQDWEWFEQLITDGHVKPDVKPVAT